MVADSDVVDDWSEVGSDDSGQAHCGLSGGRGSRRRGGIQCDGFEPDEREDKDGEGKGSVRTSDGAGLGGSDRKCRDRSADASAVGTPRGTSQRFAGAEETGSASARGGVQEDVRGCKDVTVCDRSAEGSVPVGCASGDARSLRSASALEAVRILQQLAESLGYRLTKQMPLVATTVTIADQAGVTLNITTAVNALGTASWNFISAQSANVVFQLDAVTAWNVSTTQSAYRFLMSTDAGVGNIVFTMAGADTMIKFIEGPTRGTRFATNATITAGGSAFNQLGGYKAGDMVEFWMAVSTGGANSALVIARVMQPSVWQSSI